MLAQSWTTTPGLFLYGTVKKGEEGSSQTYVFKAASHVRTYDGRVGIEMIGSSAHYAKLARRESLPNPLTSVLFLRIRYLASPELVFAVFSDFVLVAVGKKGGEDFKLSVLVESDRCLGDAFPGICLSPLARRQAW